MCYKSNIHTLAHLDINDFWYLVVLHFGVMNFGQSRSVDRVEILLRIGSNLTCTSLLSILSPILPILFKPFLHNRTKQEHCNEHEKSS